jgi:hypothetical protein
MDALPTGRVTWTLITFGFTILKDRDEVDGEIHRSMSRWSPRNSLKSMVRRRPLEEHGRSTFKVGRRVERSEVEQAPRHMIQPLSFGALTPFIFCT